MNAYSHREEARALRANRQQVAALLSRYPHVSDSEVERIDGFLRAGRDLDVGMVAGDAALKPQLDRFIADQSRRALSPEGLAVIAAIFGALFLCVLVSAAF
jgi:hypothetical protein